MIAQVLSGRAGRLVVLASGLLVAASYLLQPATSGGAEPLFVGVLALIEEPGVSAELGLTDAQKQKLVDLIVAREEDAVELVLKLKDLSPGERAEKLAPFRLESEEKGFQMLTAEQVAKLKRIRVRRLGLASLAEPTIAKKVGLTAEQQAKVAEILRRREDQSAHVSEEKRRVVTAVTERELAAVLTAAQTTAWDAITADAGKEASAAQHVAAAQTVDPAEAVSPGPAAFPDDTTAKPDNMVIPTKPDQPVASDIAKTPATAEAASEKTAKVRFSFRYQPWEDVLDWFAEQAGLSLVLDAPPKGTFNYTDDREYTPAEAIDLLNSVLLTKGYTLIRRNRMLMLINLEDGIPPNLVPTISLDDLDNRGEYELVTVLFQLEKLSAEELEPELKKMIGPQGSVVSLPKARQILVTETAGRLRAMRRMIQRSEDPEGLDSQQIRTMEVVYADPNDALAIIRQFLDIPPEQNASQDGSVRIVLDPTGTKLLVAGKPEKITRVSEILKTIDVPESKPPEAGITETPQLEVYAITAADPQSVLNVMQTLLGGSPDARLALDPKTGNLVALARPADQATIRATLDQMQRDTRKIEVFHLATVDPEVASLSINKFFGGGGENSDPNVPQVDSDSVSKQLIVRASETQLEQIRELLKKMGESGTESGSAERGGNVRMLPLTGRAAKTALEQAQQIWPTMRRNRIRVVTPSAVIPTMRPGASQQQELPRASPDVPADLLRGLFGPGIPMMNPPGAGSGPVERTPAAEAVPGPKPEQPKPTSKPLLPPSPAAQPKSKPTAVPAVRTPRPIDKSAGQRRHRTPAPARVFFASQGVPAEPAAKPAPKTPPSEVAPPTTPSPAAPLPPKPKTPPDLKPPADPQPQAKPSAEVAPESATKPESPPTGSQPSAKPAGPPADIVVTVGSGGIMIASEDLDALDDFEDLLTSLADSSFAGSMDVTIFYLKHTKAEVVAETLDQILGGGTTGGGGSGGGGGGGLLGDIAGAALGDAGGGILGSLLGIGGSGGGGSMTPTGALQITPDPRLNALVVQAGPADTEMVEQLLKILDQKESPEEILVTPKPRIIPVLNTQADEVAEIVKQVYQDRMISGGAAGGRPPSPQEFIQMLRGGRRGGGSRGSSSANLQEKMAIGVDSRNNALIVVAPDQLFQEVKALVEQVDLAAGRSNQKLKVVTLHRASPEAVQKALSVLVGEGVQFGRSSAGGTSQPANARSSASSRKKSSTPAPRGIPPAMQQQLMKRLQGMPGRRGAKPRR